MTRKPTHEADEAVINQILRRLGEISRRTKWRDLSARSAAMQEIENLNREMLDAYNLRRKYREDIPRIRKLYSVRGMERLSSGAPIELAEFSTQAASLMQKLENTHGAFPTDLRMNIYRAMIMSYFSAVFEQLWVDSHRRARISDQLNETKRRLNSLDQRDAAIVAEWQALAKDMPGKGQRDEHLAEKYGLECGRSVFNIRKKAGVK